MRVRAVAAPLAGDIPGRWCLRSLSHCGKGRLCSPLGITISYAWRCAVVDPVLIGVGRTAATCRGLVGEIPHWHPCPGAPARLAVLLPGKWVALGGRCGWVWDEVHRAHPGVSALVVA